MQKYLVTDYETRSEADLKRVGAYEYANHPTTQILCVAWKLGTKEELETAKTQVWSPAFPSPYGELVKALLDPKIILVAHNAFFEQVITRFVLTRLVHQKGLAEIPSTRWICTASLAAALALPRNLEGACAALKLPVQKDMEGRRLILKYCKPRKATKNNSAKWHSKASDLKRLMAYCATDVAAETGLFLALPPLHPTERMVWELDQKINFRGFEVDRPLVKTVLGMIETETQNLNEETFALTEGAIRSATQRNEVLRFITSRGVTLPDLTAKTISDALKLKMVDDPKSKRLLEIRQAISKTSTAKYEAFEMRSRTDSRVRDNLVFHAASTGRWGGAGVQPQNFPRGTIKDTIQAAEILGLGDLELVRLLYGNPMGVFSSCLRSVIKASEGKEFFCADYAAIEARVLFWIAKHETGVKAFLEGRDMYKELAAKIFSKPISDIDSKMRFVGKQATLGCGYQMGHKKFMQTCDNLGQSVSEELAQAAVNAYRTTHYPVVKLWGNIERAAHAAVKDKTKRFKINYTTWYCKKDFLFCELPSGRRIAYYGPEIKMSVTSWGEKRPTLYHWGVDPISKKWVSSSTYGGKLTENVIQAISRDFMAAAMLRIEDAGYEIVLSVHDELLAERGEGQGSVENFCSLMATLPEWGAGAPIRVEGWAGKRYKK